MCTGKQIWDNLMGCGVLMDVDILCGRIRTVAMYHSPSAKLVKE